MTERRVDEEQRSSIPYALWAETSKMPSAIRHAVRSVFRRHDELAARVQVLEEALRRAVYIAEHLFQMVPLEVWRDSGGDDGQGHYEGDYHAEQTREELKSLAALQHPEPQQPEVQEGERPQAPTKFPGTGGSHTPPVVPM